MDDLVADVIVVVVVSNGERALDIASSIRILLQRMQKETIFVIFNEIAAR